MMENKDLVLLRQNLKTAFNMEDFRSLCFNMGISYEDINGQTPETFSIALIEYCNRRGLLPKLITYCQKERPHIQWRDISTSSQPPSKSANLVEPDRKSIEKKGKSTLSKILLAYIVTVLLLCCGVSYAVLQGVKDLFDNTEESATSVADEELSTSVAGVIPTATQAESLPTSTVPPPPTQTTVPTTTPETIPILAATIALSPTPLLDVFLRSCQEILENGQSQGDGYYTIDADGIEGRLEPFQVYCDMTRQEGGWTLYAYHVDGIRVFEVENVTITEPGVMMGERWKTIRNNMTTGMMFVDEFGKVSWIDLVKLNAARCQLVQNASSLLPIAGPSSQIWHDENDCNGQGQDYSIIILKDSIYENYRTGGASLVQRSDIKFYDWPYPSDFSYTYQNELFYFIK